MVMTNQASNIFSIRFQKVSEKLEQRNADLVVDEKHRKEFFELVSRFGLEAIYTDNDVWYITPGDSADETALKSHTSTWDIMFHKYWAASNDFKHENKEYHRKAMTSVPIPIMILNDLTGSNTGQWKAYHMLEKSGVN